MILEKLDHISSSLQNGATAQHAANN